MTISEMIRNEISGAYKAETMIVEAELEEECLFEDGFSQSYIIWMFNDGSILEWARFEIPTKV